MKTQSLPFAYKARFFADKTSASLEGPPNCPHINVDLNDGLWRIADNCDERLCDLDRRLQFPTAEMALAVGLQICRAHDRLLKDFPVPKTLNDAIERTERKARDLEKTARDLCFTVNSLNHDLRGLRKAAGMPPLIWREDDLITQLDSFATQGGEHPFFSESTLYDLLGKEDARSVLALIAQVKRRLDPIGGAS